MGSIDSSAFTDTRLLGIPRSGHAPRADLAALDALRHAWTQDDVADVLEALYPRGDASAPPRQQLCSAFLAGVAASQDELLLRPRLSFAFAAILAARTLLKNRAASPQARLWHAFAAGRHAAAAQSSLAHAGPLHREPAATQADAAAPLRLFIRQPFTESNEAQQSLIADVLAQIDEHNGSPHPLRYLTGHQAESADTFKASFEAESGRPFTPRAFRHHRLSLLAQAEAFVNIRVGMSESSAFELSYHIFRGACTPVLFLVWKHAPIKTTLLKDLGDHCDITYLEFERAEELRAGVGAFFRRCRRHSCAGALAA